MENLVITQKKMMPKQLVFIQFLTAINKLSFYCMCNILILCILCFSGTKNLT